LEGVAFSTSGIGFRGREVRVAVAAARETAGGFLEVLGMPPLCPVGLAYDMA